MPKVASIEDTGKRWNDMVKVKVVLDNGRSGIVNAKGYPPPYGVGDEVEVKEAWPDGNIKKIGKVNPDFQPSTPAAPKPSSSGGNNRGQEIGMCMNNAVNILCATEWRENPLDVTTVGSKVEYIAKELLGVSERLRGE